MSPPYCVPWHLALLVATVLAILFARRLDKSDAKRISGPPELIAPDD